jgi:hypothetical protein
MRWVFSVALVIFYLLASIHLVRGTLVVVMVPYKGDYVVVAAESRHAAVPAYGSPADDRACKIVELGRDTLFFDTGYDHININPGKPWDATSVARHVYRQSPKRDPVDLVTAWGNNAIRWFNLLAWKDLQSITYKGGGLVTGGFVSFDDHGSLSAQDRTIYAADHKIFMRPDHQSIVSGQVSTFGMVPQLVREFFDQKTKRAVDAVDPILKTRRLLVDPSTDADAARNAIQFAIDNLSGEDRGKLGGPIDVAIIRKDRTIEWVSRKAECYKMDQNPVHR